MLLYIIYIYINKSKTGTVACTRPRFESRQRYWNGWFGETCIAFFEVGEGEFLEYAKTSNSKMSEKPLKTIDFMRSVAYGAF